MRLLTYVIVVCALAAGVVPVQAQGDTTDARAALRPEPPAFQRITLRDASILFGWIERIEGDRVHVRTVAGATVEVGREEIVDIVVVRGRLADGEFRPDPRHTTRTFFGPTARALPRGAGYIGVYELFYPFVEVGVTDRIAIGGGTPLLFITDIERPFWFTPKVQVFRSERVQAATGVIHIVGVGRGAGIGYAVATIGSPHASISGGLGIPYSGGEVASPIVMVSGERRVSRKLMVMTENWVWRGSGFLMGGVRFLGDTLSTDIGLLVPLEREVPPIPMVNLVWRFGSR
jgi:hypothetical protein